MRKQATVGTINAPHLLLQLGKHPLASLLALILLLQTEDRYAWLDDHMNLFSFLMKVIKSITMVIWVL